MRGLALHWKILIGMIIGILLGLVATSVDSPAVPAKQWVVDWIKPFGTMFINALKMIAIPLIVASLANLSVKESRLESFLAMPKNRRKNTNPRLLVARKAATVRYQTLVRMLVMQCNVTCKNL